MLRKPLNGQPWMDPYQRMHHHRDALRRRRYQR
ncbi:Uncharacterised protein [Vibrio cholerae]|nr:Uncharacterised protein [Vibrio cholerae]